MKPFKTATKFAACLSASGLMLGSVASAAPTSFQGGLDPLVAVSFLSNGSSRAAVCAAGAGSAAASAASTQGAAPARQGCVLPVVDVAAPPPVPVAAAPGAFVAPVAAGGIGPILPLLAGLAALTVALTQLKGKGGDSPNRTTIPPSPISPA